jgi:ADP-heptose:LPS heptosyltransferase
MPTDLPRVLVYVHEDLLGDALLKLPAVSVLREAFPGHHITWLSGCGPSAFRAGLAPLVAGMVDEVQDRHPLGQAWREWLSRPQAGPGYDVIIDTQKIVRSTLLLRRLPHRLFISGAARFLLSHRKPPGRQLSGNLAERLLQLIRLASGRDVEPSYHLRLPPVYRRAAEELLPAGPVYVGLAPGAGGRDKCWPLERYLELGREQRERGRTPVFFIGPREREWVARIRAEVPDALLPELETAAGVEPGPLLSLALAERLSLGVANDSGAGHLLAAAGAPLVSLFGRTSTEKFVEGGEERLILRARDFGGNAMVHIPYAAVAQAVDRQLRRRGRTA